MVYHDLKQYKHWIIIRFESNQCRENIKGYTSWTCLKWKWKAMYVLDIWCPQFCPNGELAPVPEGKCCPSRDLCPLQHCQGISCPPKVGYPKIRCSYPSNNHQRCPTGDLAPIPRNSCCPSKAECDNTNCSQVRCIVERCSDGSIAPVPQGQCCPSKRACPTQAYSLESSYSKGSDCTKVTCYLARCPGSNTVAPVPWGNCCPNIGLCPLTHRVFEADQPSNPAFQQSIESF